MIRNLKTLGLALVAVFAFSAMAASGAMAQTNGVITSDGPVTLKGTNIGAASENQLSAFGLATQCPKVVYTGHEVGSPTKGVPNGSNTATITPHYNTENSCVTAGFPTTVDMNGCDYVFHLGETTESHAGVTNPVDTYNVKATVVCPAEKHPVVTVFGSVAKHTANEPFCVITITENAAGYDGLVARGTTVVGQEHDLDITGTITGIVAHRTSPTGSILCTNKTDENATLAQNVTVKGFNAASEPTPVTLSH